MPVFKDSKDREVELLNGVSETKFYTFGSAEDPFLLFNGRESLDEVTVAYQTYGTLNADASNAVLVFHALSGSQHLAGWNESVEGVALWTDACKPGWWDAFVGPGRALDTNEFFVVCANYLGGCYGSTGPRSINPKTGTPYAGGFPHLRMADIVDVQVRLLDHLGIETLHSVIGASFGGCLAQVMATRHPQRTKMVVAIATGIDVPILTRIHNFEQICAIEEDPDFNKGYYYDGAPPNKGLALARMIAHKNYISLDHMLTRATERVMPRVAERFDFYEIDHSIESYLCYAGNKFVRRFDSNTYLRILEAWQKFDLAAEAGAASIEHALSRCGHQHYLIFSIDTDVCFYPVAQRKIARCVQQAGIPHHHLTVHSSKGHDAFLLEPELFAPFLAHDLLIGRELG